MKLKHSLSVISFLFFLILSGSQFLSAQNDAWGTLSMVEIEKKFQPEFGIEVMIPTVSPLTMALNGKVIEVEGYYIALTAKTAQSHYMLSRYPQSMCFFCGKAGPETAMQVFMKDNIKVPYTEEKITVKGVLSINPTNPNELLYTLTDAVLIKK